MFWLMPQQWLSNYGVCNYIYTETEKSANAGPTHGLVGEA